MAALPPEKLVAMLKRAQLILEAMIIAGDSGTVTIGYGNKGLRLVVNRHEKSVSLEETDEGTPIRKVR
jgi:hypothetical protein